MKYCGVCSAVVRLLNNLLRDACAVNNRICVDAWAWPVHNFYCSGHVFYTNPPLVITEEELRWGFSIIDKNLTILDEAMED